MNNWKNKKVIMVLVMGIIPFINPTNILAEETNQTITTNGQASATVTYSQDSSFSVNIDKTINLNSETKSGTYTIVATGDISADKEVVVEPVDDLDNVDGINITMHNQDESDYKKPDVNATIVQTKTVWQSDELGNITETGNITAENLTAGVWSGTLNFNIALRDKQ